MAAAARRQKDQQWQSGTAQNKNVTLPIRPSGHPFAEIAAQYVERHIKRYLVPRCHAVFRVRSCAPFIL